MAKTNNRDLKVTQNLGSGSSTTKDSNSSANGKKWKFKDVMAQIASSALQEGAATITRAQSLGKAIDQSPIGVKGKEILKQLTSKLPSEIDDTVLDALDNLVEQRNNIERKWGDKAANWLMNQSLKIQSSNVRVKSNKEWMNKIENAINETIAKFSNKFKENKDSKKNHAEWYNKTKGFSDLPLPDFSKNMRLPLALGSVDIGGNYYIPTVRAYYIGNPLLYGDNTVGAHSEVLNDVIYYCYGPVVNALLNYKNYALEITPDNVYRYMFNICSIHAILQHIGKLMNVSNWYDDTDFTVPTAIFQAAGIALDTTVEEYAILKTKFTNLIGEFKTIPYPHIAMFDRIKFLYYNFFKEESHSKTSYYFQIPYWVDDVYKYDGTALGEPINGLTNISDILDVVKLWIKHLRTDNNFILLGSAFVNAYGRDAFKPLNIQVRNGDELYNPKNIVHSEDLEMQLHNGTVLADYSGIVPSHAGVGEFPLLTKIAPAGEYGTLYSSINTFNSISYIDTKSNKPITRDDVAKLTKFQGMRTTYSNTNRTLKYLPMGTEFIMGYVDVKLDESGEYESIVSTNGVSASFQQISTRLLDSMRYDSQPPIARMIVDLSDPANEVYISTAVLQDFNKYGVFSINNNSTLQSMVARSLYQAEIFVPEKRKSFVIK